VETISAKIEGYGYEAKSHSAVAAAVKNDRADVGFGIRTVAVSNQLDFIKLDDEKYDFLIAKPRLDKVSVKRFVELIKSRNFAESLAQKAPGLRATEQSGLIVFPTKT
jgi:putative molybdopterin biosynthesis protein